MPQNLLQTKLFTPVAHRELIPRSHLWARLNAGLDGRLTLVSAPAGFGKTNLIVQWSRELAEPDGRRFAWFSLDENDNDLHRFFEYFIAALQRVDSRLGQPALELLHSPQGMNIQVILTDLLNTLSNTHQTIVLVLDDYHLITNPEIHEGLTFLIENAPPHFHILMISRADPPFSLARLRARNQLTEIRQADLRFSQTETRLFLNHLMGLELPGTAIAGLEKRTEGWVAGLQMAALSMQGQGDVETFLQGFTSSNRYIFDYMIEEVLNRRPAGTREFLLQTAILDRMCAPLCDAVLGVTEAVNSASQQILEQLDSANLFLIPLDDERRWYRYHHLFADLLRQQWQRENPGVESPANRRASRWFEKAGYAEEAVQYALRGADYDRAASLITKYGESWLRHGEISKVVMWSERLPAEWRQHNPKLMLNLAWALSFAGRAHDVEAVLSNLPPEFIDTSIDLLVLRGTMAADQGQPAKAVNFLDKAERQLKALEPNEFSQTLHAMTVNALAFSFHMQGDRVAAKQNYQAAIALNLEVGNQFAAIKAVQGWSVLLLGEARLHEAEAVLHDGLKIERQLASTLGMADSRLVSAAPLHLFLGQLYYDWNQLAESEAHIADSGELVAVRDLADQCMGLTTLAKLRLAQGQAESITPILSRLKEIKLLANPPYVSRQLEDSLAAIRCALFKEQPSPELRAAIEQSLSQLSAVGADPLILARVLITLGRVEDAIPLLEKLTVETQRGERFGYWLPAAVLLCLAYQEVREIDKALALLNQAVQIAAASGCIRIFLDEGEPLQRLLEELVRQEDSSEYAAQLLSAFPAAAHPIPPLQVSDPLHASSALSPREKEVLQLIASGLTNREIAAQLVIAPSTAKRHTVNIYNKLGINNRAEAASRAYELGIARVE